MHEFSGFALTILAVLCTAWLNRADARNMKADLRNDMQSLGTKIDNINGEIVQIRERLARLEEPTATRCIAS